MKECYLKKDLEDTDYKEDSFYILDREVYKVFCWRQS
jgi:hypothetical protein